MNDQTQGRATEASVEEFETGLQKYHAVRSVFMKHHADLLEAAFWQTHQSRIRAGHVFDVFPYEQDKRFNVDAGINF